MQFDHISFFTVSKSIEEIKKEIEKIEKRKGLKLQSLSRSIVKLGNEIKQLEQVKNRERNSESNRQQMFVDQLKIEFSTNRDFSDSYCRTYEEAVIETKTIKALIYAEREIQNAGFEELHARVTIIDNDPENMG
jgi:hypothetical protein